MAQQKRVRFFGNVQGVGFRYTTMRIAGGYAVTGWVQNLPDGSVELVAEGSASDVADFVEHVKREMGYHIRETRESTAPASGQYDSFGVRH